MNGLRPLVGVVVQRELMVKLRDKTFIGSTIFLLVVITASVILPWALIDDNPRLTVGVVGTDAGVVAGRAAELGRSPEAKAAGLPSARVDVRTVPDQARAEAGVRDGTLDAALMSAAGERLELVADRQVPSELTTLVATAAGRQALVEALVAAGAAEGAAQRTAAELAAATPGERLLDPGAQDRGLVIALGAAFAMIFFLASFLFGMSIAMSVVEEKQSRVVEILVAAVPVRVLLAGKVIANTVLALGQTVLLLAVGLAGASVVGQGQLVRLILGSGGWFLVFFVLGFTMLATLWAGCGAVASRQEDLNATTLPMQVLLFLPLFAAVYVTEPGLGMRILSYVPFTAPLSMPQRLMLGDAAWWEALLSAGLVVLTALAIVSVAAKLYERNLLRTSGRIPWREALRA